MFKFFIRRSRLKALSVRLDRVLTGHTDERYRFHSLYTKMIIEARNNGKTLKMFGSKQMTMLHWIRTKHVYFEDGTSAPFNFYK